MSINFIKKNKRSLKKTAFWLLGIAVLLAGICGAYLLVGSKMPWGQKAWFELSKIVPVPIASVAGQKVYYDDYWAAAKLGAADPLDFAVEKAAIKEIAASLNLATSSQDIDFVKAGISDYQNFLDQKDIASRDFESLVIEPDILAQKITAKLNKPNAKVREVESQLKLEGADFAALARKYSEDEVTAPLGGDIGFVGQAQINAEAWQAAKDQATGAWTGPISTGSGYVFIQTNGKQPASDDQPEKLNLRVVLIKSFDFRNWFEQQLEKMDIKLYI